MEGFSRFLGTMIYLFGPLAVNLWEFDNRYPVTAMFIGIALAGLYAEMGNQRSLTLKVHKMLWQQRYPDEPWG